MAKEKIGYHLINIKKGEIGKSSKMLEEVEELMDAEKQNCKVMVIIELSDLLGAVQLYIEKNNLGVSIPDLVKMSEITRRAFENGYRK